DTDMTLGAGGLTVDTGTFNTGPKNLISAGLITGAATLDASTGGPGTVNASGGLTVTTFMKGTSLTFGGAGAWSGGSDFGHVVVTGASTTVTLGSTVGMTFAGTALTVQNGATLKLAGHD